MTRQLHTEVEIEATPDRVWAALTDFAAYQDWNPFIVQAAGRPVPGTRLELRMGLAGRRSTSGSPRRRPGRRLAGRHRRLPARLRGPGGRRAPCRAGAWYGRPVLPGVG